MKPSTNHLRFVGLLLVVLAVAGCAAVTPEVQSQTESTLPTPTSTIPSEEVEKPVVLATATDLPDPTVTPTPSPTQTPTTQPRAKVVANDYGAAPEINTEVWLNTDQPLRLEDLRGQVVLVDFWTYG